MIKMYNGKVGFSKMVHVILEDSDGAETLCGIKSKIIIETDKPVTCKSCMSDAQLIHALESEDDNGSVR